MFTWLTQILKFMNKLNRIFNCKDEELIPLSKFTLYSLKRDLADFTAFSPKFNIEFIAQTELKITDVENLLEPQAETLAKKVINDRIEKQLTTCNAMILHLDGYLRLAKQSIGVNKGDFGIIALRKAMNNGDMESLLNQLGIVLKNVMTYEMTLKGVGMPESFSVEFKNLCNAITADRQQQFEIISNRMAIVQNNLQVLNSLYEWLQEIYAIGKVLYSTSNNVKYKEYTFTELLKKVRLSVKTEKTETKTT